MYKRLPYLALAMVPLVIAAPLRASPPLGAVVQSWHYDPQTHMVTFQVVNMSHKDITAYNISIKETYVDGHVNSHELMVDSSGALAVIQEVQGTADEENLRKSVGDGVLHPGASREEINGAQPGLQNFEAVVDVVAYADQTAEATNNDAFQRLVSHRKVTVATRQAANDIIRAALANANDPDPAATAAKEIRDRITVWKAQKHATIDFEQGVADGIADELQAISSQRLANKRDALTHFLTKSETRITALSPHTKLTKIGGQS